MDIFEQTQKQVDSDDNDVKTICNMMLVISLFLIGIHVTYRTRTPVTLPEVFINIESDAQPRPELRSITVYGPGGNKAGFNRVINCSALGDGSPEMATNPEEVECFQLTGFSQERRYQYTHATRVKCTQGRKEWLRLHSKQRGFGTTKPNTYTDTEAVVSEILDEIIDHVVGVSPLLDPPHPQCYLFERIFGQPSKCGMFDKAEITTMETKNCVHPNIAEFWCFATSVFYGSSLLLYYVKEEDWFEKWREDKVLPRFIHLSTLCSFVVMICSLIYHSTLFEITGCIDCFFASFVFVSVIMSTYGVSSTVQVFLLLSLGIVYVMMWRYSTRIAIIVLCMALPFGMLSCSQMKGYYGWIVGSLSSFGYMCFILDRHGYAPLHSLWHVLGGGAITLALYNVVINGPVPHCLYFGYRK